MSFPLPSVGKCRLHASVAASNRRRDRRRCWSRGVIGPHMGATSLADLRESIKRLGQARVEVKGVLYNGQLQLISSRYGYKYSAQGSQS